MSIYNILSVQICPKLADKQYNLNKVKEFIEQHSDKKLDLVIMPEFFSTGIDDNVFKKLAETEASSETIEFFSKLAKKYNTNILTGTIIEKDGDDLYNSTFFINRQGHVIGKYRKIHLFDYFGGNEGKLITSGDEVVVVDSDMGKIGLSICFDIRFPLLYNKLLKKGAQIITCSAAWSIDALNEWELLNQTHALNNAAFFVSSSLCGKTCYEHSGNSMVVSPMGKILARAKTQDEALLAQIDIREVKELRNAFPIMNLE